MAAALTLAMSSEKHTPENTSLSTNMDTSTKAAVAGSVFEINEKALVRRIDYRIVPLMFFCYLMQFLDKVIINVGLNNKCSVES